MPDAPTWDFIREAAAAMTDRDNEINGICLRGKAGWGEGGAFITVTATRSARAGSTRTGTPSSISRSGPTR
jgi:hypothetical protein